MWRERPPATINRLVNYCSFGRRDASRAPLQPGPAASEGGNRRLPSKRLDAQPDRHRPGRPKVRGDHVSQRPLVHSRDRNLALLGVYRPARRARGSPKTGKTLFHLALAKALSTGGTFLDFDVPKLDAIWLLSEASDRAIGPQMRMLGYNGMSGHRAAYAAENGTWQPEELADALRLAYAEAEAKPDLIVVDTLARFVQLEDSSSYSETTNAMAAVSAALSTMPGVAGLLVHHARKNGGEGSTGVLGSTALAGSPDILINLRKSASDKRTCTIDSRLGLGGLEEPTFNVELSLPAGVYKRLQSGTDYPGLEAAIGDLVDDEGIDQKKDILARLVIDGFTDATEKTVGKALGNLVTAGALFVTGSTRDRRYSREAPASML